MRDGALERWVAFDMQRMRDAIVTQPQPLFELLQMESPAARTRSGTLHPFDRAMLERFRDALPPLARRRLRLPITLYVEHELADAAYVVDEAAMALLRALGEVPEALEARDGRLWFAHARARVVADRWRGAFQFTYL